MKSLISFAALINLLCLTSEAFSAESQKTPHQIISKLMDRMYVIGETSGKYENFTAAEKAAVIEIQEYSKNNSDQNPFIEKNRLGQTPLISASFMGYSEIVSELLSHEIVKLNINDVNSKGMNAWVYSNFAYGQAMWTCNPNTLNAPFALVPRIVTIDYYLKAQENPYKKTRQLLEKAGATPDLKLAKKFWMDTCASQTKDTQEKMKVSKDIQQTAIDEGNRTLNEYLAELKKKSDEERKQRNNN